MERLTQKAPDSEMVWFKEKERLFEPCEMSAHQSRMAIAKLAEYEQAEEQGLLLRLPCKVGDSVYRFWYVDEKPYKVQTQVIRTLANLVAINTKIDRILKELSDMQLGPCSFKLSEEITCVYCKESIRHGCNTIEDMPTQEESFNFC